MNQSDIEYHRESWCQANLQQWKLDSDGIWGTAICCLHDDSKASLRINLQTGGYFCHGCQRSGNIMALAEETGLSKDGLPKFKKSEPSDHKRSKKTKGPSKIVAEYVYRDQDGKPVLKVLRHDPKDFTQQHYSNGEWVKGAPSTVTRYPYRLPEILESNRPLLIWVEGEKDADLLWSLGVSATTSPQGASSLKLLKSPVLECLAGKKVVVIPDNDTPGKTYASHVCKLLHAAGVTDINLCELDNVPDKGDFSDWWVARPRRMTDVSILVERSIPWAPSKERSVIRIGDRELHDLSEKALESLLAWNSPPRLFCDRFGRIAWLNYDAGEPKLSEMNADGIRGWLSESAQWVRGEGTKQRAIFPDTAVAKDIVIRHPGRFPKLDQIVMTPVFDATGRLIAKSGYDDKSKIYMDLNGLSLRPVPERPSQQDVEEAKRWIFNDLFVDFSFVDEASRCHCFCALILPFVRRMMNVTPLHLIESPTPGSGKGLIGRLLQLVVQGGIRGVMTDAGDNEDEWRKRIFSTLGRSPVYVLIDNVGPFGIRSDALAAALTSETYEDRILGLSKNATVSNETCWLATGNNIELNADIARRSIWCRIDKCQENPQMVRGYKHDPIEEWALENRSQLVWACLVLAQNWIASGRPRFSGGAPMGSFEKHNYVVGGICEVNGIRGFLGNYAAKIHDSDLISQEWRAFFESWWEHSLSSQPRSASELVELIENQHHLEGVLGRNPNKRQALGRALSKHQGRVYSGLRLEKFDECGPNKASRFKLVRIGGETKSSSPLGEIIAEMVF